MVNPCCGISPCNRGKQNKAQNEKDDGEWIEPIRRKSRKHQQVSAEESTDKPRPSFPRDHATHSLVAAPAAATSVCNKWENLTEEIHEEDLDDDESLDLNAIVTAKKSAEEDDDDESLDLNAAVTNKQSAEGEKGKKKMGGHTSSSVNHLWESRSTFGGFSSRKTGNSKKNSNSVSWGGKSESVLVNQNINDATSFSPTLPKVDKNAIERDTQSTKQNTGKGKINGHKSLSGLWGNMSRSDIWGSSQKNDKKSADDLGAKKKEVHSPMEQKNAITLLAPLGDGYFLTASQSNCIIKMWKSSSEDDSELSQKNQNPKVDFVCDFEGHSSSGIMDLKVLDKKGRFLSAGEFALSNENIVLQRLLIYSQIHSVMLHLLSGKDSTIRLWDSRYNCNDDPNDGDESKREQKPITLLANFKPPNGRRVHSIAVLDSGDYVRPTDEIDMAMIKAMAIKAAFEGSGAVNRAAAEREIISCSGTFATASTNDKLVRIWEIDVADKENNDHSQSSVSRQESAKSKGIAKIALAHELKNDFSIVAMSSSGHDMILVGDVMGDVILWQKVRSSMVSVRMTWTRIRKFTWVNSKQLYTPEEITKQSITLLSFLEGEDMFVVGTKRGVLSVWEAKNKKEIVSNKESIRLRVRNSPLTGLQKLPAVKDPKTKKSCRAFSTSYEDGFVVSIAMRPQERGAIGYSSIGYSPFVFHALDYSSIYHDDASEIRNAGEANAITSVSALDQTVIAADMKGGIYNFSVTWSSSLGFGEALTPVWKSDTPGHDSFADEK